MSTTEESSGVRPRVRISGLKGRSGDATSGAAAQGTVGVHALFLFVFCLCGCEQ